MEEITQLIQQLDEAHEAMRSLLRQVEVHKEIYAHWTMKQIIAHLVGWDDAVLASLQAHAADAPPATPAIRGIDIYNAQTVAEREALNYEQIVKEWDTVRNDLKVALAALPPHKYAQPMVFPWGESGSVRQAVRVLIHHEKEHAQEIQALAPGQADGS